MANPNWTKGKSGNPKGRPKKERALTGLLERAGSSTIEVDGLHISGKRLMARMVWEGVIYGEVHFPDGKKMRLSPTDWKSFVQWIYTHIDGPPKSEVDLDFKDALKVIIEYANPEDNPASTPSRTEADQERT